MEKNDLSTMRHSCSHLMAAAILELYPETKIAIGPAIENGFYYDFEFKDKLIPETLEKIEEKMRQLKNKNLSFVKNDISIEEAKKLFKNQPYKIELINDLVKENPQLKMVSTYKTGDFTDLCAGPHVENTKDIGSFKLLNIAGAYWRGDEKKTMLTRIYGTCFKTKEELDKYLWQVEEAKKRDHKKLGRALDLFIIPQDVGPGLAIWLPKGAIVRRELENFLVKEQVKRGYQHIYSPHVGKKSLWVTSGHWDLYRDKMYSPMEVDKDQYLVKPMNCPMHIMVYKDKPRSYKDLPLRIAEIATVYRYEQPGELAGLTRVRYITQDDAHIFCREDQVTEEFKNVLDYTFFVLKTFNLTDFSISLSVRDPKNKKKYLGEDSIWQEAESKIVQAIKEKNLDYKICEGEAAFYGPKLDISIKDALGRSWQCTTIQVDFMLPARFKLEYIDSEGKIKQPVMIHRTILGSMERFMAILIEHYAGAFPAWLAPVQAVIIPITERNNSASNKVAELLTKEGFRVELDTRNDRMQAKIRDAQNQKIPYMLILGDKEMNAEDLTVAVRTRQEENLGAIKLVDFIAKLKSDIENKA